MSSQTATVETLVAEVRVLMVGSRQVTLSVARQLDWRPLDEIEPFGRVRLTPDTEELAIIGKDRETGGLVRASLTVRGLPFVDRLSGKVTVCGELLNQWLSSAWGGYHLTHGSDRFEIDRLCVEACGLKHEYGKRCEFWQTNGLAGEIEAQIAAHRDRVARYRAAGTLPLIVLAGLR